jgi:hypothetical protein
MSTPTIRAALDTFQQAANRGTAVYLSPELVQELRAALEAEPEGEGAPSDCGYEAGTMWTGHPATPTKPQPTGGRLIYSDRDPGPAEVPCDELMQQWKKECQQLSIESDYAIPASSFMAQRVVTWARQQQAQSPQIPPPGAEPVATDEELMEELADLWPGCMPSTVRRTIYQKGRADERTAIFRALGVEP